MKNTQKGKGTYKGAKLGGKFGAGQSGKAYGGSNHAKNNQRGALQSSAYSGSNLSKNHAPGKLHASLYKGSKLAKNHKPGAPQSTLYTGNKLDVANMTSHVEGV